MAKYFGTDGIRGIALEKLNTELAFRLGQAIAVVFSPKEVVIGIDTRESSPLLGYAVAHGLNARGVNVIFAGVVSTPMIAYYSKIKNIIGVMITASHNPFTDNGIKVFNNGYKTLDEDELKLEAFIDHGTLSHQSYGQFKYSNDIETEYLNIYEKLNLSQTHSKILFDSAHGANYQISRKLFSSITNSFHQIGNQPDGKNINLSCGSTQLSAIQNEMKKQSYDIGFSFDGDGDRIIALDSDGTIYDGDMIIYIIGKYLKSKHLLNKNTVVLTKMSNPGLLQALKDHGISYELTDIGDKYVFKALEDNDYTIGGESSGHVILRHLLHSGDGLLVAIYLIKILDELKTTLKEMTKDVTIYPLKTTNIKGISKEVLKKPNVIQTIESIKLSINTDGLLLVRPSGTESLIRITVSHKDESQVENITQTLVTLIEKEGQNL